MNTVYKRFFGFVILLFLLSSCGNYRLHSWSLTNKKTSTQAENLWLASGLKKAVYKINIEAFHQKQSGILIVKQNLSESFRLLMLTEFGLKVFDVEYFKSDSVVLHYIMKHLDIPYVKKALFDNLKLFVPETVNFNQSKYYNRGTAKIERFTYTNENWDYQYDLPNSLVAIRRFKNRKLAADVQFDKSTQNISIQTKHPHISIRLKNITDASQ
jgi:hypothetical protein